MSDYAPRTRVGRFKVRFGGRYVKHMTVWRDAYGYFVRRGAFGLRQVRPVEPPQDYPGRRSEGLIEWEVV